MFVFVLFTAFLPGKILESHISFELEGRNGGVLENNFDY